MKSLLLFLSISTLVTSGAQAYRTGASNSEPAYFSFISQTGNNVRLSGSDLASRLTKDSFSKIEKDYLDENYSLEYTKLPENYVDGLTYATLNNEIYVEEKPYSYKSGLKTYTWTPTALVVDGNSYSFSIENGRNPRIAKAPIKTTSSISVKYDISYSLDKSKVNTMLNSLYSRSSGLYTKWNEYVVAKQKYDKYVEDLANYEVQHAKYLAYQKYLADKAIYDAKLIEYNNYVAAYDKYVKDAKSYEEYLVAKQYYDDNWEANYKAYQEYPRLLDCAEYQLAAMDILWKGFEVNGLVRVAAESIMGQSVTEALTANRADMLSIEPAAAFPIDDAASASTYLRTRLIPEYKNLKTKEEKFSYYRSHQYVIKNNAEKLLRSLDKLYRFPEIERQIRNKDKTTQFIILVSELAYFCNAIDDYPVYNYEGTNRSTGNGSLDLPGAKLIDENWTFAGKTFRQWLGNNLLDTTKTATPQSKTYPTPVELLIEPTPVEEPVMPKEVAKPVEPAVVPPATEPDTPVYAPEPTNPNYSDYEMSLIDSFGKNEIKQHGSFDKDVPISFSESIELDLSKKKNIAVFRDEYNESVLYYSFYNTGATFEGVEPFKEGDGYADSYSTVWKDEEDNIVNLTTLTTSVNLHADFVADLEKMYRITFVAGDKIYYRSYPYGAIIPEEDIPIPSLKDDINESGRNCYYEFDKWDKDIATTVTESTAYVALFNEIQYIRVTYRLYGIEEYEEYKLNEVVNEPDYIPETIYLENGYPYEFSHWDTGGYKFGDPLVEDVEIAAKYFTYYQISFVTYSETISQWIKEGEMPHFDHEVEIPPSSYSEYFTFDNEWSTSSNGSPTAIKSASENVTYYALYEKHETVISEDAEVELKVKDEEIKITSENSSDSLKVDVSALMDEIKKISAKSCIFSLNDTEITFSKDEVSALSNSQCETIEFYKEPIPNTDQYHIALIIKDQDGNLVENSVISPTIVLSDIDDPSHCILFEGDEEDGIEVEYTIGSLPTRAPSPIHSIKFKAKINTDYYLKTIYNISIKQFETGVSDFKVNKTRAYAGETISISYLINTESGYEFISAFYQDRLGNKVEIEDDEFIMPNKDVTIYVKASRKVCTYSFYVDGKLFTTVQGLYGNTIELPEDPVKLNTADSQFVFIGWDKPIDTSIKENIRFDAIFDEIPLEFEPDAVPSQGKYKTLLGIGILVGSIIIVGLGAFFLIKFLLKKKTK